MEGDNSNMLEITLSYKNLSRDVSKHKVIIKDKTMVQFLAYSLDSNDERIVRAALETLDYLIKNKNNHKDLRNTFGVAEAILATSKRTDLTSDLTLKAQSLNTALECSAYSLPSGPPSTPINSRKSVAAKVFSFHIFGLNEDKRADLIDCLVGVRGVISVVADVSHQRATVQVIDEGPDPETLASAVSSKTTMCPVLLVTNADKHEVLKKDCIDGKDMSEDVDLPGYLPEDESPPVKDNALLSFGRLRSNASSWVRSASAFLQDAFYW